METHELKSRTARHELLQRGKPYFCDVGEELSLGYRKNERGGKWVARRYLGDGQYEAETIGVADDGKQEADGYRILSFNQARDKALKWGGQTGAVESKDFTVADAMAEWLKAKQLENKSAENLASYKTRADLHIVAVLGHVKIAKLTTSQLRSWLADLGNKPRMLRHPIGEKAKPSPMAMSDDETRKRRANANRVWSMLRAALNLAFAEGKVKSDLEWRRVKPFAESNEAKVRDLDESEITHFLNAAEPSFRKIASAALLTGARYGELARLKVEDFNRKSGSLHIATSKSGKPRHVFLTTTGIEFFENLTAGRPAKELMFITVFGNPWVRSTQSKPQRDACRNAHLEHFGFHILRHAYASHCAMNGMSLQTLAKNLGHANTLMTEKHYAHLANKFVQEQVQKTAPSFGIKPDEGNVVPLVPKPALPGGHQ